MRRAHAGASSGAVCRWAARRERAAPRLSRRKGARAPCLVDRPAVPPMLVRGRVGARPCARVTLAAAARGAQGGRALRDSTGVPRLSSM